MVKHLRTAGTQPSLKGQINKTRVKLLVCCSNGVQDLGVENVRCIWDISFLFFFILQYFLELF